MDPIRIIGRPGSRKGLVCFEAFAPDGHLIHMDEFNPRRHRARCEYVSEVCRRAGLNGDAPARLEEEVIRAAEQLEARAAAPEAAGASEEAAGERTPWDYLDSGVEPVPGPVDGVELIRELEGWLSRFVVLPPGAPFLLATWAVATWMAEAFDCFTYLAITSATKGCGKSTLVQALSFISCRPLSTASITEAALFRLIEKHHPTLFVDEAQGIAEWGEGALLRVLCAGANRGPAAVRCERVGDTFVESCYDLSGFKAIACIGDPPDVLLDRALRIELRRKKADERTAPFLWALAVNQARGIRSKLLRVAADRLKDVAGAYMQLCTACSDNPPAGLANRALAKVLPLAAVVKVLAPARLDEFWQVVRRTENPTFSVEETLLAAIAGYFDDNPGSEYVTTAELVQYLRGVDGPWLALGFFNDERRLPAAARWLSRKVGPFGISPVKLPGGGSRGYRRADFADAFARWLPWRQAEGTVAEPMPPTGADAEPAGSSESAGADWTDRRHVPDSGKAQKAVYDRTGTDRTDRTDSGEETEKKARAALAWFRERARRDLPEVLNLPGARIRRDEWIRAVQELLDRQEPGTPEWRLTTGEIQEIWTMFCGGFG